MTLKQTSVVKAEVSTFKRPAKSGGVTALSRKLKAVAFKSCGFSVWTVKSPACETPLGAHMLLISQQQQHVTWYLNGRPHQTAPFLCSDAGLHFIIDALCIWHHSWKLIWSETAGIRLAEEETDFLPVGSILFSLRETFRDSPVWEIQDISLLIARWLAAPGSPVSSSFFPFTCSLHYISVLVNTNWFY